MLTMLIRIPYTFILPVRIWYGPRFYRLHGGYQPISRRPAVGGAVLSHVVDPGTGQYVRHGGERGHFVNGLEPCTAIQEMALFQ